MTRLTLSQKSGVFNVLLVIGGHFTTNRHVRFTQYRHVRCNGACPLCANSGHPDYSITSSARATMAGGMVTPKALAVLRLSTNSNCVGCKTGISAGFDSFRICPTYSPAWRYRANARTIARKRANCGELPNKTYTGELVSIGE